MHIALAWAVGTILFALGMVLADRWFWSRPTTVAAALAGALFEARPS